MQPAERLRLKDEYNRMIAAIERKAEALCPGSLALIGVYGSCATGDTYARSDLDLMILIQDERGRCLSDTFILDDVQGERIGFDLYCTTWAMLEQDAVCEHARLAKLMDAEILCVKDPEAVLRLEGLRRQATSVLESEARFDRVKALWEQAKGAYAEAILAESLADARVHAAAVLNFTLDGLMLAHGRYFKRGVKRTFEEIAEIPLSVDPAGLGLDVIRAATPEALGAALTVWMRAMGPQLSAPVEKDTPSKENLAGSYEEMFSNWRNKMAEAEERGDLFASFMNLASLEFMMRGMAEAVDVEKTDAMGAFDPSDLHRNTEAFDRALAAYQREYARVGMTPRCFAHTDAFLENYLKEVENGL